MEKLMQFLDKAHSVYHSIALLKAQLEEAGYTVEQWADDAGGIQRAVIARLPEPGIEVPLIGQFL